jgi:hypothetical protein
MHRAFKFGSSEFSFSVGHGAQDADVDREFARMDEEFAEMDREFESFDEDVTAPSVTSMASS